MESRWFVLGIKKLSVIRDFFLDCIFPVFCVSCGAEGRVACEKCLSKLKFDGVFFCPRCHCETVVGVVCLNCKKISNLSQEIAAIKYAEDELIGRLVKAIKYEYRLQAFEILEPLLDEFLKQNRNVFSESAVLVPVPLHPRRQAERGFNQAQIIAEALSRALNLPVCQLLRRSRYTVAQATLKKNERQKNIQGAFVFKSGQNIYSNIILVDDIFTTGSTLEECARVIRAARPEAAVSSFTLARG